MSGTDKRYTILVVDDTPDNIVLITEMLRDEYKMKASPNGEAALRVAHSQHRPDLILLDVMMPGMDGYEVCRRLRADPATADIPVIFQTALSDSNDEVRGLELGAVDYITKPINPHKLRARVATHLALAEARRQLEQQNEALRQAAELREDVDRIMRHDLKAPLNVIIGVPQFLVATGKLAPDQMDMLGMIEESGQRMLQMINMTLDLMKMERGTYRLTAEGVDLIKVIKGTMRDIAGLARRKKVDLDLTINGQPDDGQSRAMIIGEWLLCQSLLSNLYKNAIEASPDETPIRTAITVGDSVELVLSNGGEVPPDMRDCFFDKYATSGKADGTGLGTYSARLICQTLNGDIAVDYSVPGQTTLTIRLPRWRGEGIQ